MKIETLLSDEGKKALSAVRKIVDPLWEPGNDSDWRPPEVDKRLTWALSKKANQFVISILAEQESSWVMRQVDELKKEHADAILLTTTGEAQSSYPDSKAAPHAKSGEIRPGVSIGHGRFRAGTLGCVVNVPGPKRDEPGVLTAAHVVALNNSVDKNDRIFSPGKPDISNLMRRYAIGRLVDYVELMPVNDYEAGAAIYQSIDIALVNLAETPPAKIPKWNEVPAPSAPANNTIRITKVIKESDMPNYINQEVFKIGRTTGFTTGKLVYHSIAQKEIKLPNNKFYLYTELFGVVSTVDEEQFSRPGDSGAPVYSAEGGLLGFVIGADGRITLCCMAARALDEMSAELVTGRGT